MMSECAGPIRIVILVDNKAEDGLVPAHGFSVWIEAGGRRILFDTGQGSALSGNAGILGVDLTSVDTLILSHGHYDHTGGLPVVIERAPAVHVYCHPAAMGHRYSVREGFAKAIDMPEAARGALESLAPHRLHWTMQPVDIAPGIGLSGPIPRSTNYEDVGGPFFIDTEAKHRDPIDDDLALWIRTEMGLVVIVGCSHAGLINTLRHAQALSAPSRIHAVVGGFHLHEASQERMNRTINALREPGPDLIVACHCTGEKAAEQIREALGERVLVGHAGARYTFEAKSEQGSAKAT